MSQTVEATKTENLEAGSEAVTVSGPSFTRTTITPEMAKDLLATAPVGVVAEVDDEAVASYAATMEADGWLNNGMTIVLDTQGHLIHGIQRLNAVVKSGVSIETFIARNIDRDVLHTFDQHRKRSYQSVLETRGVQHPGRVTRLMSKLIRLENGMLGFPEKPISWSRYDLVFKANPEIVEAVAFSDRFKDTYLHSTARPTLCFMALRAGHREKLIQFMTQLRKNIPSDRNFAPGALRHQFGIVASSSPDGLLHQNVETLLAWGIQAFNMFLENKEVEKPFSWRPDYGVTPWMTMGSHFRRPCCASTPRPISVCLSSRGTQAFAPVSTTTMSPSMRVIFRVKSSLISARQRRARVTTRKFCP